MPTRVPLIRILSGLINSKGICEFHNLLLFYETWIFPSSLCSSESLKLLAHVKTECNDGEGVKGGAGCPAYGVGMVSVLNF